MKKNNGIAGVDIAIAIVAVMIFSTLMLTLIINNSKETVKTAKETIAMIYMTEFFENISIAEYDEVTQENINKFIPEGVEKNYEVQIDVEDNIGANEDIIKRVQLTLRYEIGNRKYECSMEKLKVR